MSGKDYEEVREIFEKQGFTNIKLEAIEDLITGWLTKDGEVEDVSVGGDVNYLSDKWYPKDTEVVIRYHTFPSKNDESENNQEKPGDDQNSGSNEEDIILTVANCPELANILSTKAEYAQSYVDFANKYKGKTIQFNGRIDYIVKHGNYDTRYDILVSAGDYDPDCQQGPVFKFEDVGVYDLGLDTLYLEDEIAVGMNVLIVAEVGEYKTSSYLFYLDPISVKKR